MNVNARRAVEAGADAIVVGTAIFGAADYAEAIGRLRSARPPVT
jgi:pentose-5-phosphate-3-epimerase